MELSPNCNYIRFSSDEEILMKTMSPIDISRTTYERLLKTADDTLVEIENLPSKSLDPRSLHQETSRLTETYNQRRKVVSGYILILETLPGIDNLPVLQPGLNDKRTGLGE